MEQNHFEILLEQIKSESRALAERFDFTDSKLAEVISIQSETNERLIRLEVSKAVTDKRLENIEHVLNTDLPAIKSDVAELKSDMTVVKTDMVEVKTDVRDIKRTTGLLNSVAGDHEVRIQGLENTVRDHLGRHS